jgi:hypothetical protein
MYTVLCVDLQLVSAFGCLDVLINTGRAVTSLGAIVGGQVDVDGNRAVFEGQVRWLVFFVVGVADEHTGELVKANDAIGLGVGNGLGLCRGFEAGVVCLVVEDFLCCFFLASTSFYPRLLFMSETVDCLKASNYFNSSLASFRPLFERYSYYFS